MAENAEKNDADKKAFSFFSKDAPEDCVPNRELFAYGAALTGQNTAYNLVAGWMFYFCANILKIDPLHVGFVTAVSRVWDGVNDPIDSRPAADILQIAVGAVHSRPRRRLAPVFDPDDVFKVYRRGARAGRTDLAERRSKAKEEARAQT